MIGPSERLWALSRAIVPSGDGHSRRRSWRGQVRRGVMSYPLDVAIEAQMAAAHIPSLSALVQINTTVLWSKAYGYTNSFSSPQKNASIDGTA